MRIEFRPSFESVPEAPGAAEAPDVTVFAREGGGTPASASLWWRDTPDWRADRTAFLGHYRCEPGRGDAAAALLAACCEAASAAGVRAVIGPIDGSTWSAYRWVTWSGGEPAFPLEPHHPDEWRGQFEAAGFTPCASYHSTRCDDLSVRDSRLDRVRRRLDPLGVHLRTFDPARFESELRPLHALSLRSFRGNRFYTDLSWESFHASYAAFGSLIDSRLVWLAEDPVGLVGFVFGYPCPAVDERPPTVVLKTLAIEPGGRFAGLGGVLLEQFHAAAAGSGAQRVIHALMEDGNPSRNLSARHGRVIRRYALYVRPVP